MKHFLSLRKVDFVMNQHMDLSLLNLIIGGVNFKLCTLSCIAATIYLRFCSFIASQQTANHMLTVLKVNQSWHRNPT